MAYQIKCTINTFDLLRADLFYQPKLSNIFGMSCLGDQSHKFFKNTVIILAVCQS